MSTLKNNGRFGERIPARRGSRSIQGVVVALAMLGVQSCAMSEGGAVPGTPDPVQLSAVGPIASPAFTPAPLTRPKPEVQNDEAHASPTPERTEAAVGGPRANTVLTKDDPRAALARERGLILPLTPNDGEFAAYSSQVGRVSFYAGHVKSVDGIGDNPMGLTAAHKTLPLGTLVRCTRLDKGGAAVVVVITDRGPFIRGRIIDLSPEAAHAIGLVKDGTARCRIDVLAYPKDETREKPKKE